MFESYKLNENGHDAVLAFKNVMASSAEVVLQLMPEGREKSLFQTKLEEAVMFGTKAISSKEGNYTDILDYTSKS